MIKNVLAIIIATVTFMLYSSVTASATSEDSKVSNENTSSISSESTYSDNADEDENTNDKVLSILGQALIDNDENTTDESAVDYYDNEYYDTDGNATLINNQKIIYNSDEMQFISVTTKDGNVFYVLINYSDEDNIDNVYFLNKVDDYDLYALLYAGDDEEENAIDPEAAADAANTANSNKKNNSDNSLGGEAAEDAQSESEKTENTTTSATSSMTKNLMILGGALVIGGLIFVVLLSMKKKNKSTTAKSDVFDEFEDEDDTEINEDDE